VRRGDRRSRRAPAARGGSTGGGGRGEAGHGADRVCPHRRLVRAGLRAAGSRPAPRPSPPSP
jgi:hypothetical protein